MAKPQAACSDTDEGMHLHQLTHVQQKTQTTNYQSRINGLYLRSEAEITNFAVEVIRLQLLLRLLGDCLCDFGGGRAGRDLLLRRRLLVVGAPLVEEHARLLVVELAVVMHPVI